MTAFEILKEFERMCLGFWSIERTKPPTPASNSEMKRWFKNKAVIINGKAVTDIHEEIEELHSLVLFPNGRRKCTLWCTDEWWQEHGKGKSSMVKNTQDAVKNEAVAIVMDDLAIKRQKFVETLNSGSAIFTNEKRDALLRQFDELLNSCSKE